MKSQGKPIMMIALIAAIVVALGILAWQLLSAGSGEIPRSAYPQPQEGQPTVEQVGPPPDVVPATTSGAAPGTPFKGR
ncbi:MAG: hypothetical protein NZ556_00610 [Fimbriimonadales bacterium]|nr:hypothetical protein [Fimbriimonadales bacterium]